MGTQPESPDDRDIFSILTNLVLLISVYLYFSGWLYAYYLFLHFGVSLHSVDIPVYDYIIYSYSVLDTKGGYAILGGVAVWLLLAWFARYLPFSEVWVRRASAVLFVMLFPSLFYSLFHCAKSAAENEARARREGNAFTIRFTLKQQSSASLPKKFLECNNHGQLRLLIQTKERYFVFYQPEGEKGVLPYADTFDISRSDVLLASIDVPDSPR